jgi:hypothetical protein
MQPEGYEVFLQELKQRIRTAQVRAAVAVNREAPRTRPASSRTTSLRAGAPASRGAPAPFFEPANNKEFPS